MGIYDRDYMKRPEQGRKEDSPESRLEAVLSTGWKRYRKMLTGIAVAVGVLVLILLVTTSG